MNKINRRTFLGQASCAGLGSLTLMNSLLNLKAITGASISNSSVNNCNDYKAIVCILKSGGNDSFNMLVPHDSDRYDIYNDTRDGIAIPYNDLLPINLAAPDPMDPSFMYACHPNMERVRDLFNTKKLSFISNVGTLTRPNTSKDDFINQVNLPLKLFSHSDQIQQWQTGLVNERSLKGWGGKIADIINSCNPNQEISMNIALNRTNIMQRGNQTVEYVIDADAGSVGVAKHERGSNNFYNQIRTTAVDSLMCHEYKDIFEKTYADVIKNAIDWNEDFGGALQNSRTFDALDFGEGYLGRQLRMIARSIDVRQTLGFKRQIFFVEYGGWDHHDTLLRFHPEMLGNVSDAMGGFMEALEAMQIENNVLTMTISEFGRTLTWNGNGSDHAWGGNTMVMGGPNLINGGRIFGNYPDLSLDSEIELGGGVIIPSISTDEYFAEVAKWFGVSPGDLNLIFPNLSEFYATSNSNYPIGFIK
ncbi:MAG: DUF1501 domain-containing protein [Bacteroidota bacterium]